MNPTKTLDEAHNYLIYIAEALNSVSKQFRIDRSDKIILEKFSSDIYEYSEKIQQLKDNMEMREQVKKDEIEKQIEEDIAKKKENKTIKRK